MLTAELTLPCPGLRARLAPVPRFSAGILLYRGFGDAVEVLIGHPGGPFWARRDEGAWTIPKGEHDAGEDPWDAATREFAEELGRPTPAGARADLGSLRQPSGKMLTVYAVCADLDITDVHSNTFAMEWPRGSGMLREFPELDRVAWLSLETARQKLLHGQREFIDRLVCHLPGGRRNV